MYTLRSQHLLTTAMWLCLIGLLTSVALVAQVEQARITGTVSDSTGAVIPGVKLTFVHVETNIEHSAVANEVGSYLSVPLRIGEYRVITEAEGFKRTVRSGVILRIQETVLLDLILEVGAVTESIDVTGTTPLLQTTDVSQGQVIDNQKIVDLPLNGRDFLTLAALSSGAFPVTGQKSSTGFSSNGMRTELNNYMLDGLDNNMHQMAYTGGQAQAFEPSVDAIQEFKVQTNAYGAEFGNNMAAVVNVTIKSGTNTVHGTLYEFLRNEKLDAKNFFDNPNDPIPPFKLNQYGGTVGGPIVSDKTFFFADFQGTRERIASTVTSTVPSPLERMGDFSESVRSRKPVQIFDPNTYDPVSKTRQPFLNQVIPQSVQDPVGMAAIGLYPLPNQSGKTNNYLFNHSDPLADDRFNARIDHNFGENDTMFSRVSYQRSDFFPSGGLRLPEPAFGGAIRVIENDSVSIALGYTHIFSPTVFNTLKLGYNVIKTNRKAPTETNYNKQIGVQGLPFDLPGLGQFRISNFRSLGTGTGLPTPTDSQVRQIKDDLSWLKGKHSIKMGVSLSYPQSNQIHHYQANGVFSFNGNFTRQTSPRGGGFALADAAVGFPRTSEVTTLARGTGRRRFYHGYIQDEYKATPKLTMTLGLRYEYNSPWWDEFNNYSNLDVDTDPANPRLILAQDGSVGDRATVEPDYMNFAPRFGFAYRVGNRTVVRTGYGIYYGGVDHIGDRYLHANAPFAFFSRFTTDSITPNIVLRDGFPANAVTPENISNLQTMSQGRTNTTPYSQQWNFTIQHELVNNLTFDIAYIGTKANFLLRRFDWNAPSPGPGNINARRRLTELEIPGVGIVSPLADTFRREWTGNSNYHGLQVKAEKRFSGGLSFLGAYMWSKAIDDILNNGQDPFNHSANRGLSNNHFPHRFVFSHNYDLPLGQGKKWLTDANPAVNVILGGWSFAGITTLSSGRRVNISVRGDPSNNGGRASDRPNMIADSELSKNERTLRRFFNTDAFVRQADFTFGNAPKNAAVGPGVVNFDLALYKHFYFGERFKLQFRFESFNAFNTPPFNQPNGQVGNSNFGRIRGAGDGRNIQFGLKLGW